MVLAAINAAAHSTGPRPLTVSDCAVSRLAAIRPMHKAPR